MPCRVCLSASAGKTISVREMMYGLGEPFDYVLCDDCGSLQIERIPDDLSRFYSDDYYSMVPYGEGTTGKLKSFLLAHRDRAALGVFSPIGTVMSILRPAAPELAAIGGVRRPRAMRLIDIGCGRAAHFLKRLAKAGLTDLTGIDPFIDDEVIDHGQFRIFRMTLEQVQGPFDVVTLHHSFEHLPDPRAAMKEIARILAPGGTCLVRIPTPSSLAFSRYQEHWCQIDAPRHLNLPSRDGMSVLAQSVGMAVERVIDDSTEFQFWGSDLYRRGIPLRSEQVEAELRKFDMAELQKRAATANKRGEGDQAAFVLRWT